MHTKMSFLIFILFLGTFITNVQSEKILVVSFMSSKSHKNVYEPLLQKLAERNHELTVISPVKGSPHPNIKEIIPMSEAEQMAYFNPKEGEHLISMFDMRLNKVSMNPMVLGDLFTLFCKRNFDHPEVQKIVKQKFDLVIGFPFMCECTFGLLHHLNTTTMLISSFSGYPWVIQSTGSPLPTSFVPMAFTDYTDKMTFYERAHNFVLSVYYELYARILYFPQMEKSYREYFGVDTPSIMEIMKNTSLILVNNHFSLTYPKPLMPDVIEVGGMFCRPPKPLPKDLEDFISGSGENGVIYFSFGSVIQASTMPDKVKQMFIKVFSKLKQRVLWKFEENIENLPSNVKISKWLPQQDILGHSNVKLFITHGGLLSTTESIYHGKPLIGVPFFGDQDWNMRLSEEKGYAIKLELSELTEEILLSKINTILNDKKYMQRATELSKIFKDRPSTALDTAVYWTEYIMRHKGASHLRSPARDLNILQYHGIDVIAFIFGIFFIILYIFCFVVRLVYLFFCKNKSKKQNGKKKIKTK